MLDHIGIHVSNFETSKAFYDKAMGALGASMLMKVPTEYTGGVHVAGYGRQKPDFWLTEGAKQTPPIHLAFKANSRAEVDAFYAAAIAAGGTDNGAPGIRAHYHSDYYGAFVRDPDGNNIEAVCHKPE